MEKPWTAPGQPGPAWSWRNRTISRATTLASTFQALLPFTSHSFQLLTQTPGLLDQNSHVLAMISIMTASTQNAGSYQPESIDVQTLFHRALCQITSPLSSHRQHEPGMKSYLCYMLHLTDNRNVIVCPRVFQSWFYSTQACVPGS